VSTILPAMQKLLLDRGWNATTTPIVLGRYPAVPDTVLALRELVDIPGKDFGSDNLPLLGLYELHMTVRCGKDAGANTALTLAWDAYRRLAGRHITVTIGVAPNAQSFRFSWVRPLGPPQLVNYDDNDRPEVVVRFTLQRVESLGVPYGNP
jgi:hypothetical protein